MRDINVTVLSATGRNTKNGKTIYDVALSDGNTYTTFDPQLAAKAAQLQSQQATARVNEQQNGKWTNRYLEDIGPVGTLPPLAMPMAPGTTIVGNGALPTGIALAPPPVVQQDNGKEKRIVTESVFSTAFNFVGQLFAGAGPEALPEATEHALTLAADLYGKVFAAGQAAQTPSTPQQEVAATVPGVTVGAPATVVQVEEQPPAQPSSIPWN